MVLLMTGMNACKKHHTPPRFPSPDWQVDATGKYPLTMTAVVQVPPNLQPYVLKGDKLGAFMGSECRGVGTLITADSKMMFFVLIHGTAAEQGKISFKYYYSWKSYMYETEPMLDFTVDGNYGTVDYPKVLDLKEAK